MDGAKIIIAFALGFIFAQGIKVLLAKIRGEKNLKKYITGSGGMPSGHAASTVATATCIGFICGFDSVIFGLAVTVVLTVIYDAVNVRYAVGEQGKVLNSISSKQLKIVEGHTKIEVFAGILLGILIGWEVFVIL